MPQAEKNVLENILDAIRQGEPDENKMNSDKNSTIRMIRSAVKGISDGIKLLFCFKSNWFSFTSQGSLEKEKEVDSEKAHAFWSTKSYFGLFYDELVYFEQKNKIGITEIV